MKAEEPGARGWEHELRRGHGNLPRKSTSDDRQKLRAEAEARFARASPAARSDRSTPELLHELQVHQIELEMQNEELRREHLELELAHEQYVDLYDFAPVGYLTLDANGLVTGANLTAATLLGRERRAMVGRRFPGFVASEDADRWHRFFSALAQHDERIGCRLSLTRGDESTFDAHLACERRTGASAESAVRIVLTDVSEFARLERTLRETKERLSLVVDSTNDGYTDIDLSSGSVKFSRRFASMLGYDLDELEPEVATLERLLHPEDREKALASNQEFLHGRVDQMELEERLRHRDGRWIWTLRRAKVVERDAHHDAVRIVGMHTDISARKAAEQALQESERWLRTSQAIARIGHYVFDVPGDRWTSSAVLDSIFGIDEAFLRTAASWIRIVHPEDRASMESYLGELLSSGTRFDREYRVVDQASGEVRWVHGLGELRRDPDGKPIQLVGTIQDATARKQAEAERAELFGKLALSARLAAMGTLVAGVAHEINNPLAAALADQGLALEVVQEIRDRLRSADPFEREAGAARLDAVVEELIDAQEVGRRIAQIVKDLASFGRPSATRTKVRLIDVVDQAMRWMPAIVGQAANVQVENGGAPPVFASSGQLEQVVVNLVTNAAKASRPGSSNTVIVRIGPGSPGMAQVSVIDQGKGIAPAIRERIFEPFFTNGVAGQGTGLGLAICQNIVKAHGGTLTVESELGRGSTFQMELPAAPDQA